MSYPKNPPRAPIRLKVSRSSKFSARAAEPNPITTVAIVAAKTWAGAPTSGWMWNSISTVGWTWNGV